MVGAVYIKALRLIPVNALENPRGKNIVVLTFWLISLLKIEFVRGML